MDPDNESIETRRQAEEDGLHQDPDRVRADPVRDPDGRHPLAQVQAQQGHDRGRGHSAKGQAGRARHHPRLHQVQATTQTSK